MRDRGGGDERQIGTDGYYYYIIVCTKCSLLRTHTSVIPKREYFRNIKREFIRNAVAVQRVDAMVNAILPNTRFENGFIGAVFGAGNEFSRTSAVKRCENTVFFSKNSEPRE